MSDQESISNDGLQAQIDLSMSFVHDMISGWMKPSSQKAKPRPQKDVDAELREYMRRPPRLGVGATIPESSDLTQSTAHLKDKLTGKTGNKHSREDEAAHEETTDTEDGESRAGAIKKKARLDPFNEHKNKKHKNKNKEKNRVESVMTENPITPLKPLSLVDGGTSSSSVIHPPLAGATSHSEKAAKDSKDSGWSVSLTPSPRSPTRAQIAGHLPLLNLDGGPLSDVIHGRERETSSKSARRKRKRRNKRSHLDTLSGNPSHGN